MEDDEDEFCFGGLYEGGHWTWCDEAQGLVFIRDKSVDKPEALLFSVKAPTSALEFRDDVDVIEQLRFRRRYQRKLKAGQADVISLQDVKDIAIYTAPLGILSPMLINMLHLSTTERFLRGLILYCQYYLQVSDEVKFRMMELETKIRTPMCDIVENIHRDNLCDLRLLVAKEYSTMLIGGHDTKKFHHMGPQKKLQSLSDKDARLFETLLRMTTQIVWLALGRKSFNQIELEVNRIFKTDMYNTAQHVLEKQNVSKMCPKKRSALLGQCVRQDTKLKTRSPLMNELFCQRQIDHSMMGLGVIQIENINPRLQYMLSAIVGPEEEFEKYGIVVGILGMPRSKFDTMLKPLPLPSAISDVSKSASSRSSYLKSAVSVQASGGVRSKSKPVIKLYLDILLPEKEKHEIALPPSFPTEPGQIKPCSETQHRRWQKRLQRLQHPPKPLLVVQNTNSTT